MRRAEFNEAARGSTSRRVKFKKSARGATLRRSRFLNSDGIINEQISLLVAFALSDIGYKGYTSIEVEDKAFEESIEDIEQSVKRTIAYMRRVIY